MQISMRVPYDEERTRRTARFLLDSQITMIRVCGLVIVVCGLLIMVLQPTRLTGYVVLVLGMVLLSGLGPLMVRQVMSKQSDLFKDAMQMTLDTEAVSTTYPLAESRVKWAAHKKVVETPEVWYVMFGQVQAVTIPKETMTEQQREEFAAFLKTLKP